MNANPRQLGIAAAALLLVLLIAMGYSITALLSARTEARYAADDLAYCRKAADNIKSLRTQDAVAATQGQTDEQQNQIALALTQAGTATGLTGEWIDNISPGSPSPIGNTPYERMPTIVNVSSLTLPQAAELLHRLTYDSPLDVADLRLKPPPGQPIGTQWDARFTLTYLVYAPDDDDD